MCKDLLLSHPDSAHVHIVVTARDPSTGLALSSRNAYLTANGQKVAPTLREALLAAEVAWNQGLTKRECVARAEEVIEAKKAQARSEALAVEMRLDYVQLNDSETFEIVEDQSTRLGQGSSIPILSGALWVDKTRLIDNIILGDLNRIPG